LHGESAALHRKKKQLFMKNARLLGAKAALPPKSEQQYSCSFEHFSLQGPKQMSKDLAIGDFQAKSGKKVRAAPWAT
jgi:hypothetical protein